MLEGRRLSGAVMLLLPALLVGFLAFNAGGFYPGPAAYVAMVLAVVLAVRVVAAVRPLAGVGWLLGWAAGGLGVYALLTLVSEHWSHAPGVALVEYDRALVYLLALVLFGSIAHSRYRLVWILRSLAVVIAIVCGCALVTRVLPHVWPTTPNIASYRLGFPVGYWNALGLLAAFGLVLCIHFTSEPREPPASKVLAAAAVPVLAVTLYFTFSRGSIAVCLVALLAYVALGRPRLLASAAAALVPTTAVALAIAYDANLLATSELTTPRAISQGHHVAVAVAACVLAAGILRALLARSLDPRLGRFVAPVLRPQTRRLAWLALAVGVLVVAVAASGTISREYHRFLKPTSPALGGDVRSRLTDPGNNGRLDQWRVAWHRFEAAPWLGQGAGTFENSYARYRSTRLFIVDAHSLYMETLDELGGVGLALLLVPILAILIGTARRARGSDRALYAAAFAILLAWALEAGIDWDWEMPVVTVIFFATGGFVLARPAASAQESPSVARGSPPPAEASPRRAPAAPFLRTALGAACLLAAVAPAYVWFSQRRLDQATAAFQAGRYGAAASDALASISLLGDRAEPYEIVAYADVHRGLPKLAVQAMSKAASLDPGNWNYLYGLGVTRAAAGLNPLAATHEALVLNPKEQLVQVAWSAFEGDRGAAEWESDGKEIADAFTSL